MKRLQLLKVYSLICLFALITMLELISSLFLHETSSLVLLVDSYHNFFTLLSLILLVISHKIKYSRTLKNTFGWARLGILGRMVNLIFFSSLLFSLSVGCIQTIAHAGHEQVQPQNPLSLIIFGSLGIVMYFVLQITAGDLTENGLGSVAITGNNLIFNCVVSTDKSRTCDNIPLTTRGLKDNEGAAGHRVTPINRRRVPSSTAYTRDTGPDLSCKSGELEHILCDSNDNAEKTDNSQTKVSDNKSMKACTLVRDYASSLTLIITGVVLISSSYYGSSVNGNISTLQSMDALVTPHSDPLSLSSLINSTGISDQVHSEHEDEIHSWHHRVFHSPTEAVVNYSLSIVDACLALVCCVIFAITFYPSAKEYSLILLQSLPKNIDVKHLKRQFMKEFSSSVLSIHDLHIWSHTPSEIIATCHVSLSISEKCASTSECERLKNSMHSQKCIKCISDNYTRLMSEMETFFAKNGVSSATIQPEFHQTDEQSVADDDAECISNRKSNSSSTNSYTCLYKCADHAACKDRTCCKHDDDTGDKTCEDGDEAQILIQSA